MSSGNETDTDTGTDTTSSRRLFFGDDDVSKGSFDSSVPINLNIGLSKKLYGDKVKLGVTLGVNGGLAVSGSYHHDSDGTRGSFGLSCSLPRLVRKHLWNY